MKDDKLTYENAVKELGDLIDQLEDKNLSLEDSLEKFKRGVFLYNFCNEILEGVEGEVKILLKNNNGDVEEKDFLMEG